MIIRSLPLFHVPSSTKKSLTVLWSNQYYHAARSYGSQFMKHPIQAEVSILSRERAGHENRQTAMYASHVWMYSIVLHGIETRGQEKKLSLF